MISEYVLVAVIGFAGVVVGALLNCLTAYVSFRLKREQQKKTGEGGEKPAATRKGKKKTAKAAKK